MTKIDKYSNLETLRVYSHFNDLTQLVTGKWPSLTRFDIHDNYVLEDPVVSHEWPLLDFIRIDSCYLITEFVGYDWPELLRYDAAACLGIQVPDLKPWPKVTLVDVSATRGAGCIFNGQDWPEVVTVLGEAASHWTEINFDNNCPKMVTARFACNHLCTTVELSDTWVALKTLLLTAIATTNITTYATWTALENFTLGSDYTIQDIVFHPEWVNLTYVNCVQSSTIASPTTWDDMLTTIDASGAAGGATDSIDIRSSNYAADINRSASANTAITNLVGKGWTYLR